MIIWPVLIISILVQTVHNLARSDLLLQHVLNTLNRSIDPCQSFSRFVCSDRVFDSLADGTQPSGIDYLHRIRQFTINAVSQDPILTRLHQAISNAPPDILHAHLVDIAKRESIALDKCTTMNDLGRIFGRWMADGFVLHNFLFVKQRNLVVFYNSALAVGDSLFEPETVVTFDEAPEFLKGALSGYVNSLNVSDKVDVTQILIGFTRPIHGHREDSEDFEHYKHHLEHQLVRYRRFATEFEDSEPYDYLIQFLARYTNLKLGLLAVENQQLTPDQSILNQFTQTIFDVETALIRFIQKTPWLSPGTFYRHYRDRIRQFRYSFQPFSAAMIGPVKRMLIEMERRIDQELTRSIDPLYVTDIFHLIHRERNAYEMVNGFVFIFFERGNYARSFLRSAPSNSEAVDLFFFPMALHDYHVQLPVPYRFGHYAYVIAHEMFHSFGPETYVPQEVKSHPVFRGAVDCYERYFNQTCAVLETSPAAQICPSGLSFRSHEGFPDVEGARTAFLAMKNRIQLEDIPEVFLELSTVLEGNRYLRLSPDQLFFVGIGHLWCSHLHTFSLDPKKIHQQNVNWQYLSLRTDAVFRQMPEFSTAFNCQPGDEMRLDNSQLCFAYGPLASSSSICIPILLHVIIIVMIDGFLSRR